jgi:hypothetical protein
MTPTKFIANEPKTKISLAPTPSGKSNAPR